MLDQLATNLAIGATVAFTGQNLIYCFIGVSLGMFVGVMPGIGALAAISLLLPVTFGLDATTAIVMLAGVFYGSTYGGSVASILLNLPGTPSSAVACLDGYPMARQGRAGVALLMTTVASFVGASIGILMMMLFSPLIVDIAMRFWPTEYFSMMLFGLVAAASVATGSVLKGLAMVLLGIFLGTVGWDQETGVPRYTFGFLGLAEGISLVVIAMGLFGVSEVIASVRNMSGQRTQNAAISLRALIPTRADWLASINPIFRGSVTGSALGALPAVGGAIAAFIAYAVEKRIARDPSRFGHGAIEGVTAPEAANNAADQTAFIPTLTLGVPGNVVMALMLGALMIHGVAPGPQLVAQNPQLFWGLVVSFWVGNLMLLILNIPLIGLWVRLLTVPYGVLYPAILTFVMLGVYSLRNSVFDVVLVMGFGVFGYGMRILGFHPAPLLLGFVLGPLIEQNLRRALILSRGEFGVFVERPISAAFLALSAVLIAVLALSALRQTLRRRNEGKSEPDTSP